MKIPRWAVLIIFFMLIPVYVHSEDYVDEKNPPTTPYVKDKNDEKSDLTVSENTAKPEAQIEVNTDQEAQEWKQIKTQSICIGGDCRSKWPSFQCANYENRPARETGDEFCGQKNQTCVAVSFGEGQNFFGECSVPVRSMHKCRCCWVE